MSFSDLRDATAPQATGRRPWRRVLLAGGVILAMAAGGAFIYSETRRAEQDRHAVINQVREFERLIRRHDDMLMLRVGEASSGSRSDQPVERDSILRDFDRLSHLADFRLDDIDVVVRGDSAVARYKVQGVGREIGVGEASRAAEQVPSAGEMSFVRRGERWQIVSHRFLP